MGHALEAATAEFITRLRAFARRRVRSDEDAEDVVQEVLARLVRHGDGVRPETAEAWLYTVARRVIIDRSRGRPAPEPLTGDPPAPPEGGEDPSALPELARCLEPMLAALDPEARELLRRVDGGGASQAALAAAAGLSPSGMKSRVQRARARLREVFDRCCAIELDRRGTPVDFVRRPGAPCGGGGESGSPS